MHRGTPNRSDQPRPIMYMSYTQASEAATMMIAPNLTAQEWFVDRINFKLTQSSKYDALSPQQQKLLSRQDHIMYIRRLEEIAREAGYDMNALQSDGKYVKNNQHA